MLSAITEHRLLPGQAQEPVVTKSRKSAEWVKPKLVRLGELKNVAGPSGTGTEGGPNGKS
jgi:hypothetical protein